MPCFEPVRTMAVGWGAARRVGRKVERPFRGPKRLVFMILWEG